MHDPGAVLVVDGDASIRRLLEVVVRMLARRPVAAGDGRSAMALLGEHSFDAIVLDLILPEVSGVAILQFLAAHAPKLLRRTVVLTTLPAARCAEIGETRDCAAILRKPFSLDDLQNALRSTLGATGAS